MSLLPLKASGIDPRNVISATHDIVSEGSVKEFLESSFWFIPSRNHKPLCTLHGGKSVDHGDREGYVAGLKGLQTGILELDDEQQQAHGNGQARGDSTCAEDQQLWEEYLVDELVSKTVSQFCLCPECSKDCLHGPGTEREGPSLQDTQVSASIAHLEDNILEHELSPGSSEDILVLAREKGPSLPQSIRKVDPSSIESSVGLTKLKSALRGGNEKQGLGPRPEVQVTWGPDVYDPPCTSTSHTTRQNHRRHHHLRSDHKNRHKGRASNYADSHMKSQKKLQRRSKHPSKALISGPLPVVVQRGVLDSALFWKEYAAPSLDEVTLKSARVSSLVLPPKGCFLKPVLSVGERVRLRPSPCADTQALFVV